MKKRLRRNAAHIQANAADHLVALDQSYFEPEIGRPERGGVPTGPRPDDNDPLALGQLGLVGLTGGFVLAISINSPLTLRSVLGALLGLSTLLLGSLVLFLRLRALIRGAAPLEY